MFKCMGGRNTGETIEMSKGIDRRSSRGGVRIVIGGLIAALLVFAIMAFFAGPPDPERGESLPNAPSLTD